MKKQLTALEELEYEVSNLVVTTKEYVIILINQAKEMEKEQIKDAWLNSLTKGDFNSADEYYNETFNKKA
jgi:hypothetical protein